MVDNSTGMRILQLGAYPPPHGGVQTNLAAIRRYLLARGIPCAVINLTRHRAARDEQVYHPRYAFEVAWLLLRLSYDIVHLHIGGAVTARLLALSLFCSLLPGKKAVLTLHSGGYYSSKKGRTASRWTLRGIVFRRFDRVILVNREMMDLFHRFGVPSERTRLICPHAFPGTATEVPLSAPLEEFYQSHSPVLLTVGQLEPEYDLPLQIEALRLVRERHPRAGLVIVGQGTLEKELRALIAGKDYSDHVLLCGDVPHAVTLRAIRECDLFLRTTLYDGDSISVREALHLAVPVVATDNRMRPSEVRLIPVGNLRALQEAIEHSLSIGPASPRAQAEPDERNLQSVLDLYNELAS